MFTRQQGSGGSSSSGRLEVMPAEGGKILRMEPRVRRNTACVLWDALGSRPTAVLPGSPRSSLLLGSRTLCFVRLLWFFYCLCSLASGCMMQLHLPVPGRTSLHAAQRRAELLQSSTNLLLSGS